MGPSACAPVNACLPNAVEAFEPARRGWLLELAGCLLELLDCEFVRRRWGKVRKGKRMPRDCIGGAGGWDQGARAHVISCVCK